MIEGFKLANRSRQHHNWRHRSSPEHRRNSRGLDPALDHPFYQIFCTGLQWFINCPEYITLSPVNSVHFHIFILIIWLTGLAYCLGIKHTFSNPHLSDGSSHVAPAAAVKDSLGAPKAIIAARYWKNLKKIAETIK